MLSFFELLRPSVRDLDLSGNRVDESRSEKITVYTKTTLAHLVMSYYSLLVYFKVFGFVCLLVLSLGSRDA